MPMKSGKIREKNIKKLFFVGESNQSQCLTLPQVQEKESRVITRWNNWNNYDYEKIKQQIEKNLNL